MVDQEISRRTLLKGGGTAVAGLTALQVAGPAHAFPGDPDGEVIPWLDQPAPNPVPQIAQRQLIWEELDSWLTPNDEFFIISHYDTPALDPAGYRLSVAGLVARPQSLTLAEVQARPQRVAVGGDRARARLQLLGQTVAEERLQGRSDHGHDCASWAASSRPAAQARSSGAADR
jgi:hypothetical protein